ncbi:MAG: hypothetical protein AABY87_09650 [bacterium]
MIKVYICEDCMAEMPATQGQPESCSCGAGQDGWVFTEKPEPGCGGGSK